MKRIQKIRIRFRITKSIIPNLLTLGNLFSGFSSIIYIAKGEFEIAAILIVIAGVFDMLDGVVARIIGATSEIGVQLDSLCDAVSFGVAPSFLLYSVYFNQIGELGVVIASLPALAGVYRLARFNVTATVEDKFYFKGLPIPGAALYVMSFVIFHYLDPKFPANLKEIGIYIVALSAPLMMISTIKFDNLPRPSWYAIQTHPWNFAISMIGLIAIVSTKGKLLFSFMLLYAVLSLIRAMVPSSKKRL